MSDKKIALIAQMLAKAESTTPEEAEALMEAAEKLMIKLGIDQAVVDAQRGRAGAPEQVITRRLDFTGNLRGEQHHLASRVCNAWGSLKVYKSNSHKCFHLHIVGYESDVDRAVTIINSLQVQAVVALKAWWKSHKDEYDSLTSYNQEKARRGFVQGFGTGAGIRIHRSHREAVQEAGTGSSLVLRDRSVAVQDYFDTLPLRRGRARGITGFSSAESSGQAAGLVANTGGHSVTQGRGISA